jgi:hypothetical protein
VITDGFEVALDISYIAATRVAGILAWFINHIFQQTLLIEYASINNLKADNFCTLLEDVDRCGWHGTW